MPHITESIVATIRQPILVLDQGLSVVSANPAFLELFKVSEEETVGVALRDLENRQWNIPELLRKLAEVRDTRSEIRGFRVEHDFREIGQRVMLINARYLEDDPGPDRVLVAIEDITERQRDHFLLEAQREFAEKVIDASRDALLILGWDLRVRSANETFYEMFQVDPAETEGRLVYELGSGQWDIPRLRELLEDVLPDNNAFDDYEVEHDFPGIGHKIMLLNARRVDHLQFILLAIEDITDRKTSDAALRDSEARLATAIEAAEAGVYEHAVPIGPELHHSSRWAEILGYSKSELPSYENFLPWLYDQVYPDDRPVLRRAYEDFIEGRTEKYRVEIRLKHKTGRWVWVAALSNARERDAQGRVTRVVGVMWDITERRRAEKAQAEVLRAETTLNRLGRKVTRSADLDALLKEILDGVMQLHDADFGNVQLYDPQTKRLRIAAQHGFERRFLEHYAEVTASSDSACGQSLRLGRRVVIEDTETDPSFAANREEAREAGYRAVQSTPIFGEEGRPLGVLSTHFRAPRRFSERELGYTDIAVRLAADAIAGRMLHEALRASEERLR